MAELRTILDRSFNYTGLISVQGLFQAIMRDLKDKDYGPREEEHSEQVFEDGRQILIKITADKDISDYAKIYWEVKVEFAKCEEVVVEKDGVDVKMFKGQVSVSTEVYLKTDMDKSYEQNALMYFIRTVIDKFVFKSYLNRAIGWGKEDYKTFESTVKSFLNFEKLG